MQNESIRVLIVHGSQHLDTQLPDFLTSAGLATRVVSESASALGSLKIWRPSVAVVDLRFPSGEAQRFCATVARRPVADSPPLVFVGEGPNLLKPRDAVPSGLVPTPIDPNHLVATVLRLARGVHGARSEPLLAR
jgi:DNA-binding response OmpR family regulator